MRSLPRVRSLLAVSALFIFCLSLPFPALAQDIVLDGSSGAGGTVNHIVWGNGTPPDGTPLVIPPNSATGNSVTINSGGSVTGMLNLVYGGYADSAATGNSVTLNGGSVDGSVYGGYVTRSSDGAIAATGNSVTVSGGQNLSVFGGHAVSDSGTATATTATGNSVVISGGTVGYDTYGGSVTGGRASSNSAATATATGNSVTISGGTVGNSSNTGSNVTGGDALSASGVATATGNSVTLSGSPIFVGSIRLRGGIAFGNSSSDAFSGNTLNIWNYHGSAVGTVQNFQYYTFVLPADVANGAAAALNVTSDVNLTDGGSRSATISNVGFMGGGRVQQPGESFTLIEAVAFVGTITNDTQTLTGRKGVTLLYDLRLEQSASAITATITGSRANPQAKALSEGWLGGLALVTQGADLVAGQGMSEAVQAARADASSGYGFGAFGTLSGGWSRYNTGSHVDMSSLSLLTGLSWGADLTPGHLTLGAFFEYGNGSYDTYNSFSNAASVHGDGNIYHIGGGILGRMDFINTGPGHFYAEASARAGGVHNEYSGSDLRDGLGRKADYDSSSAYYGLHLGTGYVWNINEKASLDLYGKYFWTRQEGDSVTLSTGDPVKFKDVDSSRLRFGTRFSYAVNEYVSPYIGAAWEHEFDGKARATTNGFDIKAPSLRGDTGIGELGLTFKPSQTLPLSFDLGVQGYVGKREGVTGSLQAKWEF